MGKKKVSAVNSTGLSRRRPWHYELEDGFWCGEYPGASESSRAVERLTELLSSGCRWFVDLTSPNEPTAFGKLAPYAAPDSDLLDSVAKRLGINGVTYRRFPIRDLGTPAESLVDIILLDIRLALMSHSRGGGKLYLHCRGGLGRTGTIASIWLGCEYHPTRLNVQAHLDELRARYGLHLPSPDIGRQRDFVQQYLRKFGADRYREFFAKLKPTRKKTVKKKATKKKAAKKPTKRRD